VQSQEKSLERLVAHPHSAHYEDEARLVEEAFRQLCYQDLWYYLRHFHFAEAPFELCSMHERWSKLLLTSNRLLILAPRFHLKTSIVAIAYPLWRLGRDPNLRIKIVASEEGLASDILREIRRRIESGWASEIFDGASGRNLLVPDASGPWGAEKLLVKRTLNLKDASVEAKGILSSGVGGRCDILIIDDPCDFRTSIAQPKLKETIKRTFFEVWSNLVEPGGQIVVIGTVWAQDDLLMALLNNPEYQHFVMPAIVEGRPVWRFSEDELREREREIGKVPFARQFLLKPMRGYAFMDSALVAHCFGKREEIECSIFGVGIDPASSISAQRKNKTAVVVVGASEAGQKTISEAYYEVMDIDTLSSLISALFNKYNCPIYFENNGAQDWIYRMVSLRSGVPIESFTTTAFNKQNPSYGLPALAEEFYSGLWHVRNYGHNPECECTLCELEREITGASDDDDLLMALWLANLAASNYVPEQAAPKFELLEDADEESGGERSPRKATELIRELRMM